MLSEDADTDQLAAHLRGGHGGHRELGQSQAGRGGVKTSCCENRGASS